MESAGLSVDARRDQIRRQMLDLVLELETLHAELRQVLPKADSAMRRDAGEEDIRRHRQIWNRIGEIGRDLRQLHEEFFWLES